MSIARRLDRLEVTVWGRCPSPHGLRIVWPPGEARQVRRGVQWIHYDAYVVWG